jgi:hypothetical protein
MVVDDDDLIEVPPPPPRERGAPATPVEKTLELSGTDFVAPEDTVPIDVSRDLPPHSPPPDTLTLERDPRTRRQSRRRRARRARRTRQHQQRVRRDQRRR